MAHQFASWPEPIVAFLRSRFGEPEAVERPGGMSGGSVFRVRFGELSVIVKASRSPRELQFYRRVAAGLNERGVATPQLYFGAQHAGQFWLILENIPAPLPRERWGADGEVVATLCRLHCAGVEALAGMFVPAWSGEMNDAALSLFPSPVAAELAPRLEALRHEAAPLFAPRCPISGDPNPANWGVRDDGTPVLFDWERFALGTPALDLAIIVPGLGGDAAFERVAALYRDVWRHNAADVPYAAPPARDLALGKLWTLVEFLSEHAATGAAATRAVAEQLIRQSPAWIRQYDPPIHANTSESERI